MANLQYLNEIKIILTMVITSRPSSRAISKGIQNDRVFPAPVGAHPITSLPAYNARAVLTWYQQGRFPKNSCTELRIFLTVHSRVVLPVLSLEILVEAAVDVLIGSHTTVDFPDRGFFFPKRCMWPKCDTRSHGAELGPNVRVNQWFPRSPSDFSGSRSLASLSP